MKTAIIRAKLYLGAVLVAIAMGVGPSQAAGTSETSDPMLKPSEMTSRAASSVLLAITRADVRLVAVGERGTIVVSDDNGNSWKQAPAPVSVALTAVAFSGAKSGWAVGHGGVVLHTDDAGASWTKQLDGQQAADIDLKDAIGQAEKYPANESAARRLRDAKRAAQEGSEKPFLDVKFWSPTSGIVVGAYGAILQTTDGGKSWVSLRERIDNPKGKHLYNVSLTGGEIYLAGEQGTLFRSTDQAQTFSKISTPYAGTFFGVVNDAKLGTFAYGLRGNAFVSHDAGKNWQKLEIDQPITITSGAATADGHVILVDESGRVLKVSEDGLKTQALALAQSFSFTGIAQASDGSLVLSGIRGTTRVTPDILAKK